MDATKHYLARALPWSEDGEFFTNIHWLNVGRDGKTYWAGRACRSVDEAASTINWVRKLQDAKDIYACQTGQAKAEEKVSKAGKPYRSAKRSRDNAVVAKSLFLDIDVGKKDGYATVKDAVRAIGEFRQAVDLPRPSMIIGSGGGVHCYWIFVEPLPIAEWQPLADALAQAARTHGLKADLQVTVDAARVLRPPGTLNYKQETPRPTQLLIDGDDYFVERLAKPLEPYKAARKVNGHANGYVNGTYGFEKLPKGSGPIDLALTAGIGEDIDIGQVDCGWLQQSLKDGGVDNDNALRRYIYVLAQHCRNPHDTAWRLVHARDTLDEEEFEREFDRAAREKKGWATCATVAAANCQACTTCKHAKAGKHPLNFFLPAAGAEPAADEDGAADESTSGDREPAADAARSDAELGGARLTLPAGYFSNAQGLVVYPTGDNPDGTDGGERSILDYPIIDAWLTGVIGGKQTLNFIAVDHGYPAPVAFSTTLTATRDTITKALGEHGLMVRDHQLKRIREFMVSWIQQLQSIKDNATSTQSFGWVATPRTHQIGGFAFAGKNYTANGEKRAALPEGELAPRYQPRGEIAPWQEAFELIKGRPALEAIVAGAFAAPLMKFSGEPGGLLSFVSKKSGAGKTSAMQIGQAVWCDPVYRRGLTDSINSTINEMGIIQHLPVFWDEIKTAAQIDQFVQLVFQLTGGREKTRLTADIKQQRAGTWQTMLLSAANESMVDHIEAGTRGTDAGVNRVFEINLPEEEITGADPITAQRVIDRLGGNFGVVGQVYAKFLGANFERCKREFEALQRDFAEEVNAHSDNRFWTALCVADLLGARYAKELGIAEFSGGALRELFVDNYSQMRVRKRETHSDYNKLENVTTILSRYLGASHRHILYTNKIHDLPTRPGIGDIQLARGTDRLDAVYVQIGMEDKMMRVSSAHFTDWMMRNGIARQQFIQALEKFLDRRTTVGKLGAGTAFSTPVREHIVSLNLKGTGIIEEMEDGYSAGPGEETGD